MLTFALKKKRTPSIAPKRHAPTVSPMSHSLNLQQARVRHILRGPTLQPKLKIGQTNDKYEQEADRVADEVMRMPEPGLQRQVEPEEEEETLQTKPLANQITPLVQVQRQEEPEEGEEEETLQAKPLAEQITPLVQRQVEPEEEEEAIQTKLAVGMQVQRQEEQPEVEEEEPIQTKQVSTHTPAVTPNLASRIQSLKGGGQPLPKSARAFFEQRFGHNFSQVRVHIGTPAAEIARTINARAFTAGRDIVFGSGQFSPGTTSGRRLLAHELTHVVQQDWKRVRKHIQSSRLDPNIAILVQNLRNSLVIRFAHSRYSNSIIRKAYSTAVPWVFEPNHNHRSWINKEDILKAAKTKKKIKSGKGFAIPWMKRKMYRVMKNIGKNLEHFPAGEGLVWWGKVWTCHLFVFAVLYQAGLNPPLDGSGRYYHPKYVHKGTSKKLKGYFVPIKPGFILPGDVFVTIPRVMLR
jgi:hypothetical protein